MQRKALIAILIACVFLALPLASAEWKGRGFYEPDTARDRSGGFMFVDPDTSPGGARQVYFSTYTSQYGYAAGTIGNPNLATTGTSILAYPTDIHAILGVWKDCNKDGYIGAAPEGVLGSYPSAMLMDSSVCPPTAVDVKSPDFVPVHNDGTWVRELLVIGPDLVNPGLGAQPEGDEPANHTNPWNIADEEARIWADWNLPEDRTYATCIALPYSRDNLESTGGFLRFADCLVGWQITGTANTVGQLTGLDAIRFDDAPRERPDQSSSILNQKNPYGSPSGDAMVTAFDCDADPIRVTDESQASHVRIDDPTPSDVDGEMEIVFGDDNATYVNATDEEYGYTIISQPQVPTSNPDGSLAATVNETESGAGDCDRSEAPSCGNTIYLGADQHTNGDIYCTIHTNQEASPAMRRNTDWWFEFEEGNYECTSVLEARAPEACIVDNSPPGYGLHGANEQRFSNSWYGLPGFVASRNPYLNRENLQPWGASYLSAYAYVSAAAHDLTTASNAVATYGSDHCSGTTPLSPWWQCDPDLWNVGPTGDSIHRPFMVKVGQAYNLLDIDCWDHSLVNGEPQTLSLIGSGVCHR